MKTQIACFCITLFSVSLLSAGCESRLTGNEGNLEFSYPAADRPGDFNKPIAVGAKLEIKVEEAGTRRRAELQSAETDDPEILSVLSFSGENFILEGTGSGNTLVSVTARVPSGDIVPDSVNMMSRVPEVLNILHTCVSGQTGYYLVDHDILLPFNMKMSNGQPVIGYGYHPVDFIPDDMVDLNLTTKDQVFMHIRTGSIPGEVLLASQIDSSEATMILIEKADINGARLSPWEQGPAHVGLDRFYNILPLKNENPVCQAVIQFNVNSETPDICKVNVAGDQIGPHLENERGLIRVEPLAEGTCTISIELPEGTGAISEVSINVVEL